MTRAEKDAKRWALRKAIMRAELASELIDSVFRNSDLRDSLELQEKLKQFLEILADKYAAT